MIVKLISYIHIRSILHTKFKVIRKNVKKQQIIRKVKDFLLKEV